ncbi:MAG: hypothetical protein EDM79_13835 [Chloroflexi bacterium]|nr:MAG: hypothetical protein EDM79_13835 [Chloroflexota bacterium]
MSFPRVLKGSDPGEGAYGRNPVGQGATSALPVPLSKSPQGQGGRPSLDTTGNKSSEREQREQRWRQEVARELGESAYPGKKTLSFLNCGQELRALLCTHCGHEEPRPLTCDLRVCPKCARKRANKLYHRLLPVVKDANSNGYRLKLVTVTMKPRSIGEDLDRLSDAIPKFVNKWLRAPGFGAVAGMEVGSHGNVHAHILYYGPYILQEKLRQGWRDLTQDSHIVDIRVWKGTRAKALREACKYAIKAGQGDPGLAAEVEIALKGKRRIRSYGIFYGLDDGEEPVLTCPDCGGSDWDLKDIFYRRLSKEGRQSCDKRGAFVTESA